MSKLSFESVRIQKAPGLPDGINATGFKRLSPKINIITGPNGAGKSTFARIIQQLIWHNNPRGLNISGNFKIDDEDWTAEVESNYFRYQKGGIDATPDRIPAAELHRNYLLALHELVNVEDKDLAERIINESRGGINLDSAAKVLDYSGSKTGNTAAKCKNYKTSETAVREAEKRHTSLKGEEDRLEKLREDKRKAGEAGSRSRFFAMAEEWLKARTEQESKEYTLKQLPEKLSETGGEEIRQIEEFTADIENEEDKIRLAEQIVTDKKNEINNLGLPAQGIPKEEFTALKVRINSLATAEQNIATGNRSIAGLKQDENDFRSRIGEIANPDSWKGINLNDTGDIERLYYRAIGVIFRKDSAEAEADRLKREYRESTGDRGALKQAIDILSEWLKEENNASGNKKIFPALIVTGGVAAAIAALLLGKAFIWIAVYMAAILAVAIARESSGRRNLKLRQDDFRAKGFTIDGEWNSENVRRKLELLLKDYNESLVSDAIKERIRNIEDSLPALEDELRETEAERSRLLTLLAAMPSLPTRATEGYTGLYFFITNVKRWQEAYTSLISQKDEQSELVKQYDESLGICNEKFREFNAGTAADATSCKMIVDILEGKEAARIAGTTSIRDNSDRISECSERIDRLEQRIAAIYSGLGLVNGDLAGARQLLSQRPRYFAARQEYDSSVAVLNTRFMSLQSNSLYNEMQGVLADLTADKAAELKKSYGEQAEKEIEIATIISSIETQINQKKEGFELEKLMADRKEKFNQLSELFESNLSSITGDLLITMLKKQTAGQNHEKVFEKAGELFRTITSNRYSLMIEEKETPGFRAFDNVLRQGFALTELSTGTRVQLLIAVRLAFIETHEQGHMLPVMADELLANSDDERARAIIEALYAISRGGRQIFYLTAQPDEVGKWIEFMREKNDNGFQIVKLDDSRSEENEFARPDLKRIEFEQTVPEPEDNDVDSYIQVIDVPHFDAARHKSDQLHVAYLSDDANVLYRILRLNINYWGQLRSFFENGGIVENLTAEEQEKMKNKVKLLEKFLEYYRIGRPVPVDWDVILDSERITPAFHVRVREKLQEANGDPMRLMELVSTIPHLQGGVKSALRNYLVENGYIPESPVLPAEEVRIRTMAYLSGINLDRREAEDFINRVFLNN
jgi:energy-coupling factor transporter ATP-binding protein EcfA2